MLIEFMRAGAVTSNTLMEFLLSPSVGFFEGQCLGLCHGCLGISEDPCGNRAVFRAYGIFRRYWIEFFLDNSYL